jgi:phosphatidylserine decarboxylase
MVIGDKKFGVVSYVLVGGLLPQKIFLYFSTPRTLLKCEHFLKQILDGYTALHCALIDRI